MIGQSIGRYKITAKLGAGGMGEVFLAEDTKLDRRVALKFLPSSMWNEAEAQQRLIREAKAASQLDHPNIVTIHGIEEFEGRPFIVMAHVRGVTLNEYCTSETRTTDDLIDLALQIADGLQHAHEAGVIHRDLKPGNILVDDRGRVRILDFGIARLRGTSRLTQVGSTIGTLAYSPPELAQGKDAEPTSDIYSLGVVMYQMLTGRLPFDGDHEAAVIYAILHEPPLPFRASNSNLPIKLQSLVIRCLEKQPEKRPQNCNELIKELKRCRTGHVSETSTEAAPSKPSIAVLPFANMSADPENEYFSDGLSEELMNALAKNPGLKVSGRTSSFSFKGKQEDLREIGQKLGVDTLLEGSVRKAGNRVRITAQLVKAADGFHMWTETYDRVLDDIFAVQDDIAKSVSEAMNVALLGKSTPKSQGNAESFNLLLQANHFASRITKESLEKAATLYQRAIAIDPNDARAWAGLSKVTATQSGYGLTDDRDDPMQTAKAAAEKAVALDPSLAEVHDIMGWLHLAYEFEWNKAGESFRRAYALAPGDGEVLTGIAAYQAYCGDLDLAIRLTEKSVELDPLNPSAFLYGAKVYATARKFEKCLEYFAKALELSPTMSSAHAACSFILAVMGRAEEALEEAMKEAPSGYQHFALAIAYHALGQKQESDDALKGLYENERWGFQIACAHSFRGEADKAFEWLERSYELHDSGIMLTKRHPLLTNLHNDPRWQQFLKKIGLAE